MSAKNLAPLFGKIEVCGSSTPQTDLPEYRYTHEYRNEDTNAVLTIQFTAHEVNDSIVDEIGAGYLAELVALPSRWYLDDVQSEEVA